MCELSPVSFHGDTIFCIDYHGEPFTPMKPIIENMGLDWRTQARKLRENKVRWGVVIMTTPSESGEQETSCLPVRKLPAFLAGINPKKVRPELRPKIELYQNESDDALWAYWTEGRAERKTAPGQTAPQADEPDDAILQWMLAKEIHRAAKEGRPFTRFSKVTGLYARRNEMAMPLRVLGRKKIRRLFDKLQARALVTIGEYTKSGGCHLDARVPQRPKPALPPVVKRPAPAPRVTPQAVPQMEALPADALDAMTNSQRAKRFRDIMREVRDLAHKVGNAMNMVQLTTHPGARMAALPPELAARYDALDQMHKLAIAGLYQAEHTLYCLYYMGEGVKFA